MGFDKSRLKVNNRLLIEVIAEQLEEVFEEIILLTNDKEKFKDLKYKIFEDIIPDSGPIGALYSALRYASSRHVFITACDMPAINLDFIRHMMELIEAENAEGVVSRKSGYIEPLYAFYSKAMLGAIENQINKHDYKLLPVIFSSKVHYIEENEVRKYSSNLDIFTNLNYQADLAELDKIFIGVRANNDVHKNCGDNKNK